MSTNHAKSVRRLALIGCEPFSKNLNVMLFFVRCSAKPRNWPACDPAATIHPIVAQLTKSTNSCAMIPANEAHTLFEGGIQRHSPRSKLFTKEGGGDSTVASENEMTSYSVYT